MGKYTGNGSVIGVQKNRKQAYNPQNGQYIKINTETNKIMGSKSEPWKNVRRSTNTLELQKKGGIGAQPKKALTNSVKKSH